MASTLFRKSISAIRKELHEYPEVSGEEHQTAARIADLLSEVEGVKVHRIPGSQSLVARKVYGPGPCIAFRAELDALPIAEEGSHPHASKVTGKSHACGHDGHMSILLRLLEKLEEAGVHEGTLVLIFQSAEETGQGAREIVDSGFLESFKIDYAYALHNIPGLELGQVYMREGTFACASVGLQISLSGRTAHAAHPEDALNPLPTAVTLFREIAALPAKFNSEGIALATPVAIKGGEANFGTSPRDTSILFTLRSDRTDVLDEMVSQGTILAQSIGGGAGLKVQVEHFEYFPATVNAPHVERIIQACKAADIPTHSLKDPFRWSEDFGQFGALFPIAMFGLGSGADTSALHAPTYDFPDAIADPGASVFFQLFKSHTA